MARLLSWGIVIAAGTAIRLASWPQVFTDHGVRTVGDDDTLYHLLRAERAAATYPEVPWFDPALNAPIGALIPWPPLFDLILATAAKVAGAAPGTDQFAAAAGFVPFLLGVALLPVAAGLARVLGAGSGLVTAAVVALLPASVYFSSLGRTDQHVLEVLLCTLVILPFARGLAEPRAPAAAWRVLLGAALAGAAWTWLGSGLYPLLLVAFAGLWHAFCAPGQECGRRMAGDLAWGGLAGAALLASSIAGFGPPGTLGTVRLGGLSGFQVLQLLIVAGFGSLLGFAMRSRGAGPTYRARRVVEAVAAAALPLGAACLSPGFRAAVGAGLAALGRADAWYANIQEFDPILFAGFQPVVAELRGVMGLYGLGLFAMPVALVLVARKARREPDVPAPLAFLLFWGAAALVLAVLRKRFALYTAIPLALLVEAALGEITRLVRNPTHPLSRLAVAGGGIFLILAPALPRAGALFDGPEPWEDPLVGTLVAMGRDPVPRAGPVVFAEWSYGHAIQRWAHRPVVASPFGTEGGPGSMEDAAAFFVATEEESVLPMLARRRAGTVFLGEPVTEAHFARSFAVEGTPPAVLVDLDWRRGARVTYLPRFRQLVAARLWMGEGSAEGTLPALERFRLMHESQETQRFGGLEIPRFKVFGRVVGAVLVVHGAGPGSLVEARVAARTERGRNIVWRSRRMADVAGRAVFRTPWATGANGGTVAGPTLLSDGLRSAVVTLSDADVQGGASLDVALEPR